MDQLAPTEARRRVLVVDDHADTLQLMEILVRLHGHEVYGVSDGKKAVELAERILPDVVLSDMNMPVMNGLALGRHLRSCPKFNASVLVGVSSDLDFCEEAGKIGFDYFALKPLDDFVLNELIYAPRQSQLIQLSRSLIERSKALLAKGESLSKRSRDAQERSLSIIAQILKEQNAKKIP